MRHGRNAAPVSAASQIDSLSCGAIRGRRNIHSDGEDEVRPAKTGGSESRALQDRSMGAPECFASSSMADITFECRDYNLTYWQFEFKQLDHVGAMPNYLKCCALNRDNLIF